MSAPVAVASIQLSEDERKRIAKDLGLDESELDSVPTKLDIAKYEVEDTDVEGFAFNATEMSFQTQTVSAGLNIGPMMRVGRIPKYILVAV